MRTLLRLLKLVVILALLLALAGAGFLFWASRGFDADEPAPDPVTYESQLARARTGPPDVLTLLTFNMAYGRGPVDDIGDLREEAEIRGFLAAVAALLREADADIVALQEVDFDAARTHHIDQLELLAREAGYPYVARITTWKANYVPHPLWPPRQHIGAMHSGQAVLSRYPILSNERVVLPQPEANPFWYNLFYLHRSIQIVLIQVGRSDAGRSEAGDGPTRASVLTVYNCHLEAFDLPNRELHAEQVVARVQSDRPRRWVVLGDMNSPPPEAPQRANFTDEPGWDASTDRTVEILRGGLGVLEVPGLETYETAPASTFTFPADHPSRRLDYLFASPSLPVTSSRIVASAGAISDHLPVAATVRWSEPDLPRRNAVPAEGSDPLPDEGGDR